LISALGLRSNLQYFHRFFARELSTFGSQRMLEFSNPYIFVTLWSKRFIRVLFAQEEFEI